jgi:hypothetical protein
MLIFLKLALPQCPPKLYHNSHLQVRMTNTKMEASLQPQILNVNPPPYLDSCFQKISCEKWQAITEVYC